MKPRLIFAFTLMGFTSLIVQTLLIREFLICFYGNELTIGLILANWIILEALGSSIGAKFSQRAKRPIIVYALLQSLIMLYFPVAVFLSRSLKIFLPITVGEVVGLISVFISSFIIIAPLSIFDGAQFPFGCRIYGEYSKKPLESVGRVYILEAIGFIIAGPIFTYILVLKLHSFQIALFVGLLNLISGLLILEYETASRMRNCLGAILIVLLCFNIFVLFSNTATMLHKASIQKQWKNYQVLNYRNSIYGNLVVTKEREQLTFFSDGIPIISAPHPDITFVEEFVHFPMLSHPNPKDILIVGGGAGGIISEILKYPMRSIDYTELDPELIRLLKEYPSILTKKEMTSPKVKVWIIDGERFIKTTQLKYDLIFINLPSPLTLYLNRYYTEEFFLNAKDVLNPEGILVLKLPGSLSYLDVELQKLNLSILNTLKKQFKNVAVIPGDFNLYLASKDSLKLNADNLIERFKKSGIKSSLLTDFHIRFRLDKQWLDWFYATLNKTPSVRLNQNLTPSGLFYELSYWNESMQPKLRPFFKWIDNLNLRSLVLFLMSLGIILFIFQKILKLRYLGASFAILSSGFTGMGLDLIFILSYQAFFGFVFHHIALLVTAFMFGLTLGGWIFTNKINRIKRYIFSFVIIEISIISFCLFIGPFLIYLDNLKNINFYPLFYILSSISGFLVGAEFPLANKVYLVNQKSGQPVKRQMYSKTAGLLYALDLMGAFFAALIISVVMLPVLGVLKTCLFLGGLKTLSLMLVAGLKEN